MPGLISQPGVGGEYLLAKNMNSPCLSASEPHHAVTLDAALHLPMARATAAQGKYETKVELPPR